jgi:hypothetical protein
MEMQASIDLDGKFSNNGKSLFYGPEILGVHFVNDSTGLGDGR